MSLRYVDDDNGMMTCNSFPIYFGLHVKFIFLTEIGGPQNIIAFKVELLFRKQKW